MKATTNPLGILFLCSLTMLILTCKKERLPYEPQLELSIEYEIDGIAFSNQFDETDWQAETRYDDRSTDEQYIGDYITSIQASDVDGNTAEFKFELIHNDTTGQENIYAIFRERLLKEGKITAFANPPIDTLAQTDTSLTITGAPVDSFFQTFRIFYEDDSSEYAYNVLRCDDSTIADIDFEIVELELKENINTNKFENILLFTVHFDMTLCSYDGQQVKLENGVYKSYFGIDFEE